MPTILPAMAYATCAGARVTATCVTINTFGPGVGTIAIHNSVKAEKTERSREKGMSQSLGIMQDKALRISNSNHSIISMCQGLLISDHLEIFL